MMRIGFLGSLLLGIATLTAAGIVCPHGVQIRAGSSMPSAMAPACSPLPVRTPTTTRPTRTNAASSAPARLVLRGGDGEEESAPATPAAAEEKNVFDLDGWKRIYSNTDDTKSIMGQFWELFDKEGWSIWFTEYLHPEDYTKKIMASNLISGWMQRLDGTGTRKIAFGNVHVFGDEPGLEIAGCWLVKGQDIPQEFKDVADYEQWEWTKADTENVVQRRAIEDYMTWEGAFGKNRKWASGKTYK